MLKLKAIPSLLLALSFIGLPCLAFGQSSPNWSKGYTPSATEWNQEWASKEDTLGFTPLNSAGDTMRGPLTLANGSPLTIPQASAPSSPSNGDVWMTSAGLFYKAGGTIYGPLQVGYTPGLGLQIESNALNVVTGTSARLSVATSFALTNADCGSFVPGGATTTTVEMPDDPPAGCKFKLSPGLGDMLVDFAGQVMRIPGYGGHDITNIRLPAQTENSYLAVSWDSSRWDPDERSGILYENIAPLDDPQLIHGQVVFDYDGSTFLTLNGFNGPCGLLVSTQTHTVCSANPTNGLKLNKSATTSSNINYFYVLNIGADVVTGAANSAGAVKLALTTAIAGAVVGDQVHVNCYSIGGTVEANGSWTGTVTTDTSHIVLVGSAFANAWTSGGICRIDYMVASLTGHVTAANGVEVKSGDATQTLVGMAYVGAANAILDNATHRDVASWFNRKNKTCKIGIIADKTVTSTSYAEVDSGLECEFVTWGTSDLAWSGSGGFSGAIPNVISLTGGFDGVTPEPEEIGAAITSVSQIVPLALRGSKSGLSEGKHYVTMLAKEATAGTVTVYGTTPASTMEVVIPQ